MRVILQKYSDGFIYKEDDNTYTIETSVGISNGKTLEDALKKLSAKTKVKRKKK